MKATLVVDITPQQIADLTDQLPSKDFGLAKQLIEERARSRFSKALGRVRKAVRKSGLTKNDFDAALAEVRGKSR